MKKSIRKRRRKLSKERKAQKALLKAALADLEEYEKVNGKYAFTTLPF